MRSCSLDLPVSRSHVHFTSLDVKGLPSCHVTPWRSGKVIEDAHHHPLRDTVRLLVDRHARRAVGAVHLQDATCLLRHSGTRDTQCSKDGNYGLNQVKFAKHWPSPSYPRKEMKKPALI